MAIDDLTALRGQLPDVFLDQALPALWEEDWLFIPVEDPDANVEASSTEGDDRAEQFVVDDAFETAKARPLDGIAVLHTTAPDLGSSASFAGAPQRHGWSSPIPPPDAFAFYLPFHYFYPTWWGVYILLENALELAEYVVSRSSGVLDQRDGFAAVRIFLYSHEAFHHIVESFATRLEVTHRRPMYRSGFADLFARTVDTNFCIEEALATAHGYRRVKERFAPKEPNKRDAALSAFRDYIEQCPPGYRRASEFFATPAFEQQRSQFAEDNQQECLPMLPGKLAELWACFPHAFSGISRVTSRVNYVVRRDSALASRLNLNLRYLRYRGLREKLKTIAHCEPVREGHGSHEIWRAPTGKTFPVPRHPGDLHRGLLAAIIKQAGMRISVSEFLSL